MSRRVFVCVVNEVWRVYVIWATRGEEPALACICQLRVPVFPSLVAFFDDTGYEFSVTLLTCERRNGEGLHNRLIYLPPPKGSGESA